MSPPPGKTPDRRTRAVERLAGLDRRGIYLFLAVALIVTMLTGWRLPDQPGALVRPIFERLEELPAGSPILISCDYTPSSAPELEPMAFALTRHALARGHRVCFISLWPEGNNLIGRVVSEVIVPGFPGRREGRDWVTLGYKAGNEILINSLRQGIASMFTTDVRGRPLTGMPALEGVEKLGDFALIIALSAGTPGLKEWILFGGDPAGVPVAGGCTGAGTTQYLPYFPRQLLGLMGGLKGAAEYEGALRRVYPGAAAGGEVATDRMAPQTVAHGVIILFVILGNLGELAARRRRGGPW